MKTIRTKIGPSTLIILALIILLGALWSYHVGETDRLYNEIGGLQHSLNVTADTLTQTVTAMEAERARLVVGKELRNFDSVAELEDFLAQDNTSEQEYIKTTFDCEDFALMLQRHAFTEGFIINCQKLPVGGIEHMDNLAIIGNGMYYIEARTDEISFAGYLD